MIEAPAIKRCVVYTRKSSEEGLEQEFNSLDAQREAGEAYIRSQMHEGWTLLPNRYDDGGISGGTMKRPGLQQLLQDVQNGKVDIIVVYKVDRLSRSLGDFGQMIELFDKHNVSFVSVTQQFNTTTSMGRLTLNILLSFSQFEREVTSERIKDKIALSKQKGMWMGGYVPLGYDAQDKKLYVNNSEAALIQLIFKRFQQLGSTTLLCKELNDLGYRTKARKNRDGVLSNGAKFTKGTIYKILNNRLYLGEIRHGKKWYEGQHEAIIEHDLWNSIQSSMEKNRSGKQTRIHQKTNAPLRGLIFGPNGHAMTPTHSTKKGKRYRYYVTNKASKFSYEECPIKLVSAGEIEGIVFDQVKAIFRNPAIVAETWNQAKLAKTGLTIEDVRQGLHNINGVWEHLYHDEQVKLMKCFVNKITVKAESVNIEVFSNGINSLIQDIQAATNRDNSPLFALTDISNDNEIINLSIPINLSRKSGRKSIITPDGVTLNQDRNFDADNTLRDALLKAHKWNHWLDSGKYHTVKEMAAAEGITSPSYASRILRLIILAPDIQGSILQGTHPTTLTLADLMDPFPLAWESQRQQLLCA